MFKFIKVIVILSTVILAKESITIVSKPIDFGVKRVQMTKDYIRNHYGIDAQTINIEPKIILLHWTGAMDLESSFKRLKSEKLFADRTDIAKASKLNVSSHYMVDRDGSIYKLMPDNQMARHVIGLNYSAIGIENIGGRADKAEDLTKAQLKANISLIKYLKAKYPKIEYVIGHYEYRKMEKTPLWLEVDKGYRTFKTDPGKKFMFNVRKGIKQLKLKQAPK
jgi:beta-N-acetylhexosaminidase